MKRIRVLIVDDSQLARDLLCSLMEDEEDIEVVGEAGNGREAVELAARLRPDLITMDLNMPVMGGMEAIREIMHTKAVPILVVSSVADAQKALEAVGYGALEVVNKPDCSPEEASNFVDKIRLLAGVTVITRLRSRLPVPPDIRGLPTLKPALAALPGNYSRIIAIACSTGGPQALAQILPALPADLPCPVVIAQHISDGFAGGMVDWLARLCKLPIRLAAEGDSLQAGIIYISPSERHFSVAPTRRVALVARGPTDIYRPSCDVLLSSVAEVFGRQAIGVILTGMGSDGAKGLARIREKGGMTLGQDEGSSVIYGMNRVAIEAGAVQTVLPLDAVSDAMIRLASSGAAL